MRGKINLDYDISPSPFNRHRALYLYSPTTDMSGNYTCKVSTLQNEVTMTKTMIVYGENDFLGPFLPCSFWFGGRGRKSS